MDGLTGLSLLQTALLVYLLYRVIRLERMVGGARPLRRGGGGTARGDGRVIPLLRDDIEPGPFRTHRDPDSSGPRGSS